MRISILFLFPAWMLMVSGCAQRRVFTIRTKPVDAVVRIDGIEQQGRAPIVNHPFIFESPAQTHRVAASRIGFRDEEKTITQDFAGNEILLELKPVIWRITVHVLPGPAIVTLDGQPLNGGEPTEQVEADVDMSVDAQNNPIQHEIVASRPNFSPAVRKISRLDRVGIFELRMEPMKKSLALTSNPPGATVTLDGEPLGTTPLQSKPMEFPVDLATNEFHPRTLRAERSGFDPVEFNISWDDGRPSYPIVFNPRFKDVRFFPEPPDAIVTIDGREVPKNPRGIATARLAFPPANETGDLKTYNVMVSKPSDDNWEPKTFVLGWDNGKADYQIPLSEITVRKVELLEPAARYTGQVWEIIPQRSTTTATRTTAEAPGRPAPQLMTQLAKGTQLGSLATAPDGSHIVFTILSGTDQASFRSQMRLLRTDGNGEPEIISDGKSLDIMPAFTPDGQNIVFSSNRVGKHMSIWRMAATGMPGMFQLTSGVTNDLWPVVDSDPQPRLYYQSLVDAQLNARVSIALMGTAAKNELSPVSGQQPRINPLNDAIVFTNDVPARRDIFRLSLTDRDPKPQNLTNTPDADECDVSWSKDGGRIVFASDRAVDEKGQRNYDIWMIDLNNPDKPVQLTSNASRDDCPVFDVTGRYVFFRSNRGGAWGIWKIAVK